jgi:multidrug efflux pump subunit AcrB
MNPIVFALRHPVTLMVALFGVACASVMAVQRTKVDIFPSLNMPVVYVCQPYGGMSPEQMEMLTNYYEFHFLYVSGVEHLESKNIQGMALVKVFFHPGTDMSQSLAETVAAVNRARYLMPPGTVPPVVTRFDTGNAVIGYLVLSSETRTVGEIQDLATLRVRPQFASIAGVSSPPAFGGNQRAIVVSIDPDKLRANNLSADDVVTAVSNGNLVSPAGTVRVQDRMPIVPSNMMVLDPKDIGKIPIRPGKNLFIDHVASVEDSNDLTTGYALVNGRRAVYILLTKRSDASTLTVVNGVKEALPRMQDALPEDVRVSFEFDQSVVVTSAVRGVGTEGILGACLTGLMVLVFLRDWRSVIVVVLNIPLALLAALVGIWLSGQTINLMTLGGLALAVGILVDEATVAVENIHSQMERIDALARAVKVGSFETAVPRLLAMLCILAVFIPTLFMEGPARALFVPLALSVGFAMVASYLLSSTFVPVMSVWLLKRYHPDKAADRPGGVVATYAAVVAAVVRFRWLVVPAYFVATALALWLMFAHVGTEIFPQADSGQFQLRVKAPTGTRFEHTEELTLEALRRIGEAVGPGNLAGSVGYVGNFPSNYPIQAVYQWTSGPEESILKVALKPDCGVRVEELKARLRRELPGQLREWLAERLKRDGLSEDQIAGRLSGLRLSFEPGDIINEVMSFGSPTPVEVVVSGPKLSDDRAFASRLRQELGNVSGLCDLQFGQSFDYPSIEVKFDRTKAGQIGITAQDLAKSLVTATSSSRYVTPVYWRDPNSGQAYIVQVQIPPPRMGDAHDIGLVPIKNVAGMNGHNGNGNGSSGANGTGPGTIRVEHVADIMEGTTPETIDRFNMRRLVSLTANVEGTDLGRVEGQLREAIRHAGDPPRGVTVDVRGQLEPMRMLFHGLSVGLGVAVLAVMLLLTAYFQSIRLALTAVAAVPAVLLGVCGMLLATGTTLNIQSFMGTIMAVGVAVANAILLVTFAERERVAGGSARAAAVGGARRRIRAILMTSCAMVAGMVPMALGIGEGGEQSAPLGRAVIGGMSAATVATLLVLPAVFAIAQGRISVASPSLDPDDRASRHYDRRPTQD